MNDELLKLIVAQQVVILKRLEKLEFKVKGSGFRSASAQTYLDELNKEAAKIVDQISV